MARFPNFEHCDLSAGGYSCAKNLAPRAAMRSPRIRLRPFEPALRSALQTDGGQIMCGPFFLTVASFGLLSVGACLGFLTAALFAAGAEPADLPKPKIVVSIPDDSEMVWQAAASLYTLGACLREGENPSGAMADASR